MKGHQLHITNFEATRFIGGTGLLGGATIFSPEQLMIDVEVIRRCKRLVRGIGSGSERWLGKHSPRDRRQNYLTHKSTEEAVRSGEVYYSLLESTIRMING
jgi:trimethylamine:corrinoid methyltransferase-like protein